MPAVGCIQTPRFGQVAYVSFFLGRRQRGSLARVETDSNNFKLLPRLKSHNPEGRDHSIEHLVAKHWALVIDKRKHYGFLSEVITKPDSFTTLVMEHEVER